MMKLYVESVSDIRRPVHVPETNWKLYYTTAPVSLGSTTSPNAPGETHPTSPHLIRVCHHKEAVASLKPCAIANQLICRGLGSTSAERRNDCWGLQGAGHDSLPVSFMMLMTALLDSHSPFHRCSMPLRCVRI